jgi:hypothetical protein
MELRRLYILYAQNIVERANKESRTANIDHQNKDENIALSKLDHDDLQPLQTPHLQQPKVTARNWNRRSVSSWLS